MCRLEDHPASRWRVTDRVTGEILEGLFEAGRIAPDLRGPRRDLLFENDAAIAHDRLVPIRHPLEEIGNRDRFDAKRIAAAFEARQVEEVADDRFELVRFLFDNAEIAPASVGVERHVRHAERLDIAADGRQRCHQFMRDVGKELTTGAIGFGQRRSAAVEIGGHAVERARERADFVTACFRRSNVAAAFAERSGGLLESTQPVVRRPEDQQCRHRRSDSEDSEPEPGQGRTEFLERHRNRRRRRRDGHHSGLFAADHNRLELERDPRPAAPAKSFAGRAAARACAPRVRGRVPAAARSAGSTRGGRPAASPGTADRCARNGS